MGIWYLSAIRAVQHLTQGELPHWCYTVPFFFVDADTTVSQRATKNQPSQDEKTAGVYLNVHDKFEPLPGYIVKSLSLARFRFNSIDSYLSNAEIIALGTMVLGTAAAAAARRRPLESAAKLLRGGGTPRFPGS